MISVLGRIDYLHFPIDDSDIDSLGTMLSETLEKRLNPVIAMV